MSHIATTLCLLFTLFFSLQAQRQEVSLLFVGDAMQHDSQIKAAKTSEGYDYSSYFQHIREDVDSADLAIVNLEVTLGGTPYRGYPAFSSPDAFAIALKEAGFDIFLTANNHILDKGQKGLERTTRILDSLQVRHTGSFPNETRKAMFHPLLIAKNGIRMAILNYTYATNGLTVTPPNIVNYIDKKQMAEDIREAKRFTPDVIIACMHWGDEYKLLPNKEQKDLAQWLRKEGVQLIIGSHPHVVQPLELSKEGGLVTGVTVYSLGNFVSGMKAPNTDGGLMVRFRVVKENERVFVEDFDYDLYWRYRPTDGKNIAIIPLSRIESLEMDEAQRETIKREMKRFVDTATDLFEKHNVGM